MVILGNRLNIAKKEEGKHFFFVNKKEAKKTSIIWGVRVKPRMLQFHRRLLRSFSSEKRPLSYIHFLSPVCPA
jgi:hypothetical protein